MKWLVAFLLTSLCYGEELPHDKKGIPLYYWDARISHDFTNFGDMLSEQIVERIVGHPINTTFNSTLFFEYGKQKLLALGSIIQMAEQDDVIWGSGINPKHLAKWHYRFFKLDVRAVRGPLTRKFLREMGISCPEIYGDPALLMPQLFPEFKRQENPSRDYIIIPHYSDEHLFKDNPRMVSCKEDWRVVVQKILDARFVISTSLHGIVVAEAFGVPARYLKVSDKEPLFKYQDYYYGTNRYQFQVAASVEQALQMGGEIPHQCDLEKLLRAFPRDLF